METTLTVPRAFASLDPSSGVLLVGIPKGVVLSDGRDVGGWSLAKPADARERADWMESGDVRVTLGAGDVRLEKGSGDDVETVEVAAGELVDAVAARFADVRRPVVDTRWTPDFGFDVGDSIRLDRCPECFDPDRVDRGSGRRAYYATPDGGSLRLTERFWFDPNLGDFQEACADYVSAAGMRAEARDTSCVGMGEPPARLDMGVADLAVAASGTACGGLDPTDLADPSNIAGTTADGGFTL